MSTIRFYFGVAQRLAAAAEWLSLPRPQTSRVVVLCEQEDIVDRLDQLLWTKSALSFVPHCRTSSPLVAETPIWLTQTLDSAAQADTLFNLTEAVPENFSDYPEVIEVVSLDDSDRARARERFRSYRASGHTIESINLAGGKPA